MIFVFRKDTFFNYGTRKKLNRCPNCGNKERFHVVIDKKFSYTNKYVYHCLECDNFYPENTEESIYKWKSWHVQKRKLNTEEVMAGKSSYKVGQSVIVDDKKGYTIIKLMNLSAKVEDDSGNTKIVPYSLIEADGVKKGASQKKKAPAKKKEVEKKKPGSKKAGKSKTSGKKTTSYVAPDEDDEEKNTSKPPAPKKRKQSVGDDVSELLSNAGTETKMVTAVKKHEAYSFINKESFKKTVALKGEIGTGLFKMRLSNLLRGAIKRSQK